MYFFQRFVETIFGKTTQLAVLKSRKKLEQKIDLKKIEYLTAKCTTRKIKFRPIYHLKNFCLKFYSAPVLEKKR